jgi:hypothetical protein
MCRIGGSRGTRKLRKGGKVATIEPASFVTVVVVPGVLVIIEPSAEVNVTVDPPAIALTVNVVASLIASM